MVQGCSVAQSRPAAWAIFLWRSGRSRCLCYHLPMAHTLETRKTAYKKMMDRRTKWFCDNGPCVKCGSWDRLELDHINRLEKKSHCVWSWSDEEREKELSKCQPLCHACHKKKTIFDVHGEPSHGTTRMYAHWKCRCDLCREANAEASRKLRIKKWGTTSSQPPKGHPLR